MKLIQRQHPALTECLIAVRVDGAGCVFDPVAGAYHLLEHLIADPMYERISQLGGRFEAHTFLEYQTFSCAIPIESAAEALRTIIKELQHADTNTWNKERKHRAQKIMKRERLLHKRNPHEFVMEKLDAAILTKKYANPATAVGLLKKLSNKALIKLAKQAYVSNRITVIALAPDEKTSKTINSEVKKLTLKRGTFPCYPACERRIREITVTSPLSQEAFIRLDFPGLGLRHPNHFINNVATELLTGPFGVLEKPLGESGSALCYDLFSNSSIFYNFAQISFGAACMPNDVHQVKKIIEEQVKTFPHLDHAKLLEHTQYVTDQEIDRLNRDPFALFDFLLLFSFVKMQKEPQPKDLLCDGSRKNLLESVHLILNYKHMAVAITKKERGSNHAPKRS